MAFQTSGLQIIGPMGSLGGVTRHLWGYVTNDDAAAVETSGYFSTAGTGDSTPRNSFMNSGDIMMVSGDADGTPFVRIYRVNKATNGTITLTRSAATAIA